MGKKLSPETVEKYARINAERNKSIFNSDNKYGYKINVNHPWVRPLYEKYKIQTRRFKSKGNTARN